MIEIGENLSNAIVGVATAIATAIGFWAFCKYVIRG